MICSSCRILFKREKISVFYVIFWFFLSFISWWIIKVDGVNFVFFFFFVVCWNKIWCWFLWRVWRRIMFLIYYFWYVGFLFLWVVKDIIFYYIRIGLRYGEDIICLFNRWGIFFDWIIFCCIVFVCFFVLIGDFIKCCFCWMLIYFYVEVCNFVIVVGC